MIKNIFIATVLAYVLNSTAQAQTTYSSPEIFIEKAKNPEKEKLEELINFSISLLESDNFTRNLKSLETLYPQVWLSKYQKTRTLSELADILKLQDSTQSDASYLRTGVILKGKSKKKPSRAIGYKGNTFASIGPRSRTKSLPLKMRLGRVHLDRFVTGDTMEKSCAINTMTHEISHTLSLSSTNLQSYFLDIPAGLAPEGVPSASYLVGTVAQCTFLVDQGRIPQSKFETCVKHFVPQPFPSSSCNDYPDGTIFN